MLRHLYLGDIADNADVPSRILLFRDGQNQARWDDGDSLVCRMDGKAAHRITAAFKAQQRDSVIDYEHQTERPHNHPDGKAPAAGWITGYEYVDGEGLYATVRWTKQAASEIKAQQYRYFSPVFYTDDDGRVCEIQSVALTNSPALVGLKPISAKRALPTAKRAARVHGEVLHMEKLLKLLGLSDDATEDQAVQAINQLIASAEESAVIASLAKECGLDCKPKRKKFVAAVAALREAGASANGTNVDPTKYVARADYDAKVTAMQTELDTLKTAGSKRELDEFLAEGQRRGKITSSNRERFEKQFKSDKALAHEWLKDAPVLAPTEQVSNPESAPGNTARDAVITTAVQTYDKTPYLRGITKRRAFVAQALREAGHDADLSKAEKKLVAKN